MRTVVQRRMRRQRQALVINETMNIAGIAERNNGMTRRLWGASLIVLACSSCGGQLFVRDPMCHNDLDCKANEHCVNSRCTPAESQPCTPDNLVGACPDGSSCQCGVCATTSYDCCHCRMDQGCVDGQCEDLDANNQCGQANPNGACAGGEVCVSGCCVPISSNNACSPGRPEGLCPSGATCVDTLCVPVSERPCATSTDGLCAAGQACVQNVCIVVDCSTGHPYGTCGCGSGADEICNEGTCAPLGCSPQHLQGICSDSSLFCSAGGRCIPNGSCLVIGDCPYHAGFCSCPSDPAFGQCISVGFCRCDEDCNAVLSEHCDTGTSQCVRDQTCQNDDGCLSTEYCSTQSKCLLKGACDLTADCLLHATDQICSAVKTCIAEGTCGSDIDCGGNQFCTCKGQASRTCAALGSCICDSDCPPAQTCNAGSCQTTAQTCGFNAPAACVGTYWCCPTGQTCCPQGKRCSRGQGLCINDGTCLESADCPSGFSCVNYVCAPNETCIGPTCPSGQYCSVTGGCAVDNTCASDRDCPAGEVCNSLFECEPAAACGSTVFVTHKVPPNMLIVLDKSGSMQNSNKLAQAKAAISTVTTSFSADIRFGLATFPASDAPTAAVCAAVGTGGAAACSDAAVCVAASCAWNGSSCIKDDAACAVFTSSGACAGARGCLWRARCVSNTWCSGKPQGSCTTANGCQWNGTSCAALATACSTSGDAGACGARPGCQWQTTCVGDSTACGHAAAPVPECNWDGSACVADAAVCSGYTPGGADACAVDSACAWNGGGTCAAGGSYCAAVTSGGQIACSSTYGCVWSGSSCAVDALISSCGSCSPGHVDVPVSDAAREAIMCRLNGKWTDGSTCPMTALSAGGYTPAKQTLANIAANVAGAGLASADRGNFVLFVTDGETNCMDSAGADACDTATYSPQSSVDPVLDTLSSQSPAVRTFVVGLTGVGHPEYLNCYAIHGGRSRCPTDANFCSLYTTGGSGACAASHCAWDGSNNCVGNDTYCARYADEGACALDMACAWTTPGGSGPCIGRDSFCSFLKAGGRTPCQSVQCYWDGASCVPVTDANCVQTDTSTGIMCYYNAGTDLLPAFENIAGQVAGCAYVLTSVPPKPSLLFVYLDHQDGSDPIRIERDPTHTSNWDFDTVANQLTIYGAECDQVKAGTVAPVVILGCDTGGG